MVADAETRSGSAAGVTADLWPDLARPGPAGPDPARPGGVGGRRGRPGPGGGGGGYLNGRTGSELRPPAAAEDIRLRDLAEIGLSATWLKVAELLGYDQFVSMWRLLSANAMLRNDDNQIELTLRPFRAYERYLRNRYIATLAQSGMKPSEIMDMVKRDLGEQLSYRHVWRLTDAARGRKG